MDGVWDVLRAIAFWLIPVFAAAAMLGVRDYMRDRQKKQGGT